MTNRSYREALDDLQFSDDSKERLAERLAAAATASRTADDRATGAANAASPPKRDGRRPRAASIPGPSTGIKAKRRRWQPAAAAACFVLALAASIGTVAYATGDGRSIGEVFDDLFGAAPAQTEVIDKIGQPIGASASAGGITVTADAIVGDKTNFAIVYTISKDDGTPFAVEPNDNGALPLAFDKSTTVAAAGSGYSGFYDSDPTDNAIQYVEKMTISLGDTIIGSTARAEFGELWQFDENGRRMDVLATGPWNLKFEIDYQDTSVELPAGQTVQIAGAQAHIDSIAVSPVGMTVDYTVEGVDDGSLTADGIEGAEAHPYLKFPVVVTLTDGTVLDNWGASSKRVGDTTLCRRSAPFERFVTLDEIASITVGGIDVPLS